MKPRQRAIDWDQIRARLRASQAALERATADDPARRDAAYRERATRLAARPGDGAVHVDELRVLVFALGAERYGLEIADLLEVVPFTGCTPIPDAPVGLLGVLNFHGTIRSVLDLAVLLGASSEAAAEGYVLFLRGEDRPVGLRVDRVESIRTLARSALTAPGEAPGESVARYLRALGPGRLRL